MLDALPLETTSRTGQGKGQHPEQGRERDNIQNRAGKGTTSRTEQGQGQHVEQGRERDNIQNRAVVWASALEHLTQENGVVVVFEMNDSLKNGSMNREDRNKQGVLGGVLGQCARTPHPRKRRCGCLCRSVR